jgi:hypothetical protein
VTELMVRTQNDGWVVGRKSDQREFYVIFDQKNANLLEINGSSSDSSSSRVRLGVCDPLTMCARTDEVRKLCSTYFNNIFID